MSALQLEESPTDVRELGHLKVSRGLSTTNGAKPHRYAGRHTGARCSECHRLVQASGGWYVDEAGTVQAYCRACAGLEFPLI
jgi:hypothetical protein